MQPQKWVSLMIILILIQITKALGEMVLLHFFCTSPNVSFSIKKNRVKTILIANASLKSFYSRLGFKIIKDSATSTNFEEARSQFHYETGKSKAEQKKTIGLQSLHNIPRRVKFLHDDRINFNINKKCVQKFMC